MADTIDALTIINRALARIGAAPLTSTETDDDQTRQAMAVHDDLVDAVFTLWSWSWARRVRSLSRVADKPFGYRAAFRFPAEAMGPPLAIYPADDARADPLRDFRVDGRLIAADVDTLWGAFVCRVAPSEWPADFRLAYTMWLAASLSVPITHDSDLAARLLQEAIGTPSEYGRGGLIGRAISFDASRSGGVAPLTASDPLTSAHRGSDWSFW